MSNQKPLISFPLRKRSAREAEAYLDGFLAGLRAAREGIDKSIFTYERTRELFNASGMPPKPEN